MGVVATFVPSDWKIQYPEFSAMPDGIAQNFFLMASNLHDNTGNGRVDDLDQQTMLLYLMTAHLAKLLWAQNGKAPNQGVVGRLSSASEGSVSASFEMPSNPSAAWFEQTQYGATYWAATAFLRTAHYRRPFRRCSGIGNYPWWDPLQPWRGWN